MKNHFYKHNLYGTRIYEIWRAMKKRCYLKSHIHYKNYGGRGITVCDEWRNNVKTFCDWAKINGYKDNLTIDRINNNGNYCPENCRWVSVKEQSNNRRNNRFITYNGETKTVTQWAAEIGINYQTLFERIKRGWKTEKILSPKKRRKV